MHLVLKEVCDRIAGLELPVGRVVLAQGPITFGVDGARQFVSAGRLSQLGQDAGQRLGVLDEAFQLLNVLRLLTRLIRTLEHR